MSFVYLSAFYFLKFLVWLCPNWLSKAFFVALARLYYAISKKRRHTILTNLNLAFEETLSHDEKERIAKECYEIFAIYLGLNFIKNQNIDKKTALKNVSFKNEQYLNDALNSGRGVIIATAHFGQWELFSLAMAAKFGGVSVVGRKLDSTAMDKILQKNREQFDIEVIEKSGAARGILRALKQRRLVGILVDQNTAKSEGVEIKIFAKRALHTPAASTLALKSGALIVPAYISQKGDLSQIEFYPAIDTGLLCEKFGKEEGILMATQMQAHSCEDAIKKSPSEYFWFHKRFKHFYEEDYRWKK